VKGIPFLVMCKVEGEREVGKWDCCRINGLKDDFLGCKLYYKPGLREKISGFNN
jgi:hypothetical protein